MSSPAMNSLLFLARLKDHALRVSELDEVATADKGPQQHSIHIELARQFGLENSQMIHIGTSLRIWCPFRERANKLLRCALHPNHFSFEVS
jgi:hypothetical protein